MNTETKTRNIAIYGRRWFERTNGNTYHSVIVYVDGASIGKVDFAYGYGSQYAQTAMELLVKAGVYTGKDASGYFMMPHTAAREAGDTLTDIVTDVSRKKDLAF